MITLKQYDTGVGAIYTLSNDGTEISLSGAVVDFYMGEHIIPTILQGGGKVLVPFNAIHTAKADVFQGEFRVTYDDGKIETYPNDEYVRVNVMKSIGGA